MTIEIITIKTDGSRISRTIEQLKRKRVTSVATRNGFRTYVMMHDHRSDPASEARERIAEAIDAHYAAIDARTFKRTLRARDDRLIFRSLRAIRKAKNDGRKPRRKTNRRRGESMQSLDEKHFHELLMEQNRYERGLRLLRAQAEDDSEYWENDVPSRIAA